ncbi:putative selenate ABC transporter substrate-binding protein [Poseidonibacter lekithochrous]|uniref:putative selenate ABC transporter substrate-binding protein n=1 Tax=Poseidonibacter lekithochrous TaxID=1904463 RepID=UPI0008FC3964|nr:putative selenate ABC transporter substrate-binding protein [Poseidonibacter lekithochrous]QKJ22588.1 putative selenate ABC transporter, substrate-binding protein [Poseidonibacter lekithochrous]
MKKILFTLFVLSQVLFSQTFTFTAIPDQDETKLKERFSKLAVYLTKELGVDVKFVPVKSYSASVAAFRNNQVQLAWFGGFSGVKARKLVKDSQAIAQGVEDPNFYSYIIAHKSTGINKAEKLSDAVKGKTFTFGSKGSTSGRLMPEYYIRETFNASPNDVFKKVGFSGNHSKTISLVQSGAYELGAVNYKVWDRELKAGNIDTSKVKVIYRTPDYYDYNFTIRSDVDKNYGAGFIKKVQNAILKLEDKEILNAFPRAKFVEAKNSDYDKVYETAKKIGLID